MESFFNFFKSAKILIVASLVLLLVMILFSVYDVAVDKTDRYAYDREEIESMEVELVNINKADLDTLCTLPDVGKVTANEIINYRNENGEFKSIEEIQYVKGISYNEYIKLLSMITIE